MKTKPVFFLFSLLAAMSLACNALAFPAPDPTPASLPAAPEESAPTAAPAPSPSALPAPTSSLSSSLTVQSSPFSETGSGPVYTITAQIPSLQGVVDPRVVEFNLLMQLMVESQVNRFREDILTNQPVTPFVNGSALDIKYTIAGQRDEIWSVKFDTYYYYDGAAHPGTSSQTITYDLETGREIRLTDLFAPNVNALNILADLCKADLAARDIGFTDPIFQSGADPLEENYARWNLTDGGLVITFDIYQVAPYAAGPQIVTIPYAALLPHARANSPLHSFAP